ncbi:MAG: glycosyltransferase, partial [Lachnospiraceae bacterium]|nr:glycosyltransferase [Lachnospiraceae bacterium]
INTSLFLEDMLTEKDVEAMAEKIPAMDERYTIKPRDMVLTLLTTSVTKRERFHIMKELSERFTVDLYTYSDTQGLPRVRRHGTISYFADMPKLFRCSKINLNITHRMIRTGIPLRVIDVLGAGGFLMSNYQQDMGDDFRDGENLAIYYSLEDLCEKAAFYLEHDEERARIAANGRRLAAEKFSLEDCAAAMLRTAL